MSEYNEGNENIEPPVKETKEIEIWDDAVFPTYSDNDLGSSTNATPTEMLQSDSDEEFQEQTVVSEEEKVRDLEKRINEQIAYEEQLVADDEAKHPDEDYETRRDQLNNEIMHIDETYNRIKEQDLPFSKNEDERNYWISRLDQLRYNKSVLELSEIKNNKQNR